MYLFGSDDGDIEIDVFVFFFRAGFSLLFFVLSGADGTGDLGDFDEVEGGRYFFLFFPFCCLFYFW